MKRTYANRPNWSRIVKKRFGLTYMNYQYFSGYVSVICMDKVKNPLIVEATYKKLCLVDDGYYWTQHFPKGKNYALTTMFNRRQEIVQWYFDINRGNMKGEDGIPYYDDLYLDIVALPTGEIMLLDEDELEDALINKDINEDEYLLAHREAKQLVMDLQSNNIELLQHTKAHLEYMISIVKLQP